MEVKNKVKRVSGGKIKRFGKGSQGCNIEGLAISKGTSGTGPRTW